MVADPSKAHPDPSEGAPRAARSPRAGGTARARHPARAPRSSSTATCGWTRSSSSASTWTTRWRSTTSATSRRCRIQCTLDKLIAKRGYPEEIRDARLRPRLRRARAGRRSPLRQHLQDGPLRPRRPRLSRPQPCSREERHALYRLERIRLSSPRYAWIDTLFALPEAVMYARHRSTSSRSSGGPAKVRYRQDLAGHPRVHRRGAPRRVDEADHQGQPRRLHRRAIPSWRRRCTSSARRESGSSCSPTRRGTTPTR